MFIYAIRRFILGLLTLFLVSVTIFVIMRTLPGDAAVMLTGAGSAVVSKEELAAVRHQLGLDRPLWLQFGYWLDDLAHLDLGTSLRTGNPVAEDVARRFPFTFQIVVMAMALAVALGLPIGVVAARYHRSWLDRTLQTLSVMGLAAPSFWLGLMIILALAYLFSWSAPLVWDPFWVAPWRSVQQLIWPSVVVGIRQVALIARMTRSTMLEVIGEDYIRTARAKGLNERTVLFRHSLRNALLPVITLVGFEFSALFGSLIITETVFNVPGLGQYVVRSLLIRDYSAAQGVGLLITTVVVLGNLAVDLIYGWLDPRVRLHRG